MKHHFKEQIDPLHGSHIVVYIKLEDDVLPDGSRSWSIGTTLHPEYTELENMKFVEYRESDGHLIPVFEKI